MKQIILTFALVLTGLALFGQSPRIRLNQITKDSITGSIVLSGSDSNMVYSRDFFINFQDSVLILFGDTLSTTATAFSGVTTDLTLTGNGTVGNELKVDTGVIATVSALSDSLAGIISSVTTDLTLTGDGSLLTPLKVDTAVIATLKALADSVATRGTVSSVSAGTQISGMGMTISNGTTTPSIATSITNAANFRTAIGAGTGNGTVTSVSGTGTVNGISLSGTVTSSGNLTLGGTLSNVNLTSQVTGTLPVANGGTGQTTLAAAGIVMGTGTSGQVAFWNGTTTQTGDNGLFWDNTNKRLGVGTTSPLAENLIQVSRSVNGQNIVSVENANTGTNAYAEFQARNTNESNSTSLRVMTMGTGYTTVGGFVQNSGVLNADINLTGGLSIMTRANAPIRFYTNGHTNLRATIDASGNVGIGTSSPTAVLHLKAGTASANTAPLKFTSGTNLTTAEAGAMEWNGTNLFLTNSSATRQTINQGLTGSATLDFGSTSAQNSADLTITVTGASDGDVVSLGVPNGSVNANTSYSAWVSGANTVTVRFNNYSSGSVDPASGTFKVFVTKF